jgi:NADPH:quinone reductase-like Zn-dependent oxidoreductase
LVIEDVESPVPGPGEVVVSMHAASVNFPDVLIIQNKVSAEAAAAVLARAASCRASSRKSARA